MADAEIVEGCGCMKCYDARAKAALPEAIAEIVRDQPIFQVAGIFPGIPGFRYACELCGNKRCPHHSDHVLTCTRSNEPGQPGSLL